MMIVVRAACPHGDHRREEPRIAAPTPGRIAGGANLPDDMVAHDGRRKGCKPQLARSSAPGAGGDPDYSVYQDWGGASEESRTSFRELERLVEQLGSVRTKALKTLIQFECMAAAGNRESGIASAELHVRWNGLRMLISEKHPREIPLQDGFTRRMLRGIGENRAVVIRDREQILGRCRCCRRPMVVSAGPHPRW